MIFSSHIEKHPETGSVIISIKGNKDLGLNLDEMNDSTKLFLAESLLHDAIELDILDEYLPDTSIEKIGDYFPDFHCDNVDPDTLIRFLTSHNISSVRQQEVLIEVFDFNDDIILSMIAEANAMHDENNDDRRAEDSVDRCKDMNMAMGV